MQKACYTVQGFPERLNELIYELNEKVEKLEHEKRALANRYYALTHGLTCIFCGIDGCRYKAKEQNDVSDTNVGKLKEQKENKSC